MSFNAQALLFCELSVLAFCEPAFISTFSGSMGFTKVNQIAFKNDQNATVFSNDSDIVISFRGTYDIDNGIEDVEVLLTSDGNLKGRVHSGFLGDFNVLWKSIAPQIDAGKKLWFTGHSMGGALAAIGAVHASRGLIQNVGGMFTYGQPRVGDAAYVSNINIPSYRWVNHYDVVPTVPTIQMGYRHFAKEFYIDSDQSIKQVSPIHDVAQYVAYLCGLIVTTIEDHDVMKYRAAILNIFQESD